MQSSDILSPARLAGWVEALDAAEAALARGNDAADAERRAKAIMEIVRAAQNIGACAAALAMNEDDDAETARGAFEARIDRIRISLGLAPIFAGPDQEGFHEAR